MSESRALPGRAESRMVLLRRFSGGIDICRLFLLLMTLLVVACDHHVQGRQLEAVLGDQFVHGNPVDFEPISALSGGGIRQILQGCRKETAVPKSNLSITPIEFAFTLFEMKVPAQCGKFNFLQFKRCVKDIGATSGCCTPDCTAMLSELQGDCWSGVQRAVCGLHSTQTAIMLDLLMRRCDEERRAVWCTQSCDERVVKPKGNLTISGFRFGFEIRTLTTPLACGLFKWQDLEACTEDLGLETGCCKKECTSVLEKVTDGCLASIKLTLCKAESNQTAIITDLLTRRCDPARRELSCPTVRQCELDNSCKVVNQKLLKAVKSGDAASVKKLIAKGALTTIRNADGAAPLDIASFEGHIDVVEALLDAGANVMATKTGGWTALDSAALNGHTEIVEVLLAAGADVTFKADNGATALHSAAYNGHVNIVHVLIEAGAQIDDEADKGWTPLHNAAYFGHVGVVQALAIAGANPNSLNFWGWTPLHWTAFQGHAKAAQALIVAGADIGAATKKSTTQDGAFYPSGRTPLHIAAAAGHNDVVEVLLKSGADRSARDAAGNTARDIVHADASDRDNILEALG